MHSGEDARGRWGEVGHREPDAVARQDLSETPTKAGNRRDERCLGGFPTFPCPPAPVGILGGSIFQPCVAGQLRPFERNVKDVR